MMLAGRSPMADDDEAPYSVATKSSPSAPSEFEQPDTPTEDGWTKTRRAERQMRERVEEAEGQLTWGKLFEVRERKRAVDNLSDERTLLRDIGRVRRRIKMQGRFLLDPRATYMQVWDMIILLALLYTVVVTRLQPVAAGYSRRVATCERYPVPPPRQVACSVLVPCDDQGLPSPVPQCLEG